LHHLLRQPLDEGIGYCWHCGSKFNS
jgi:hypothetical protein